MFSMGPACQSMQQRTTTTRTHVITVGVFVIVASELRQILIVPESHALTTELSGL
jgi:hypothetical protein